MTRLKRLPIGTRVQLMRNDTIVTGNVEIYEEAVQSESFPVSFRWKGAVHWTISGTDECTVIPATSTVNHGNTQKDIA